MTTVYLNGKYVPKEQAMIPVEDRGFIFGDGIYEVVRLIKGRVFAWEAHAARLANGLDGLRISRAGTEGLKAVCEKLVADNPVIVVGKVEKVDAVPAEGEQYQYDTAHITVSKVLKNTLTST